MDINSISTALINNSIPIITVFSVLVHVFCGLGIAKDIPKILDKRLTTILLPKNIWILIGLISGVWGLLIYWLIHHSNISKG
ncbi:hypothetical protein IB642_06820 [Allofrancisella guangzhouensis]|uniref:Membrane protein n=1 Tax=Allofrancisella guangzhouensis TaxID=594679 RepID=A0A0A8E5E4_9GAMM|nr:hypothetical protein [Allofrancisella guangzhouensis]AJC48827.1 membrane protein [Allofrancisella guangzhouensis]MBK2027276.1 hypothetical protein [Allofrancisella guangzhouensis]MBK2044730.1 hypothetical protein [Allofrancisella guangzhouensis]MBK2045928.1 hypothetical protein [Allofrancisella guangzhouensis]